jgi:hypothetical protein
MPWFQVVLSDRDIQTGKHMALQNEFASIFMARGGPSGAGMFTSRDYSTHIYYFSPKAVEISGTLLQRYAGTKCDAPSSAVDGLVFNASGLSSIPFADANLDRTN